MKKDTTQDFKKRNLFIVVLLSIVTFGIYIGYWFLSTKPAFQFVKEKNEIPFKWWVVATIYLSLSLVISVISEFILSLYGLYVLDSIDLICAYLFIALLYYSIFRIKEVLEDADSEIEFNSYLLFFFHIWYIQYKLNKHSSRGLQNG
ncbi:hypothetical protein ACFOZ1_09435 [Gracilibacillus marinus]|uniref:DUF4234 domain-containing protein n=1 Tax=Gracilibacillus marinus TaxID=630535 RepID=A0ABV8VU60_9BACI